MCTYQSDLRNKSNWTSLSFSKIPHLSSEKLGGESKVFKAQLKLSLKWEIDLVLIMCLFKLSQDVKKAIGYYQQRFCVKPLRLSSGSATPKMHGTTQKRHLDRMKVTFC